MISTKVYEHNGKTIKVQVANGEPNIDDGVYLFPLVDGVYKNGPVYPLEQGMAGVEKMIAAGAKEIEQ